RAPHLRRHARRQLGGGGPDRDRRGLAPGLVGESVHQCVGHVPQARGRLGRGDRHHGRVGVRLRVPDPDRTRARSLRRRRQRHRRLRAAVHRLRLRVLGRLRRPPPPGSLLPAHPDNRTRSHYMIDRQTESRQARKPVALVAIGLALAFAASARPARAQEPAPPAPPAESPAPTPPAESPAPVPPTADVPPPVMPTVPAPAIPAPGANPATGSWFDRPPLTLSIGEGKQKWSVTFYGFVEADYIFDTTRSYNDYIG